MNTKETEVILEAIRLTYPNTFTYTDDDVQKVVSLWATLFRDVPYNQVNYALKTYIMTNKSGFAPTPGQLNGIIAEAKMGELPSADEGWSLVRKAISNGLYGSAEEFDALPELCQRVVGSADQLYDWTMLDAEGLNVVRSTFLRRYAEVLAKHEEYIALPENLAETRKMINGQNEVKQLAERITNGGNEK